MVNPPADFSHISQWVYVRLLVVSLFFLNQNLRVFAASRFHHLTSDFFLKTPTCYERCTPSRDSCRLQLRFIPQTLPRALLQYSLASLVI
jgi:hypothetical protein